MVDTATASAPATRAPQPAAAGAPVGLNPAGTGDYSAVSLAGIRWSTVT
jgi:hypothetical protein